MAGIAITQASREKYAFSRSYLQFPARFVVAKTKPMTEPLFDKLQKKRVGVLAGSAHERMLRDYFGGVEIVSETKPEDFYGDLKAGRIDAGFGDGMSLAAWLAGAGSADCCRFAGGPYLAPEYLGFGMAIATKPDDPALAGAGPGARLRASADRAERNLCRALPAVFSRQLFLTGQALSGCPWARPRCGRRPGISPPVSAPCLRRTDRPWSAGFPATASGVAGSDSRHRSATRRGGA